MKFWWRGSGVQCEEQWEALWNQPVNLVQTTIINLKLQVHKSYKIKNVFLLNILRSYYPTISLNDRLQTRSTGESGKSINGEGNPISKIWLEFSTYFRYSELLGLFFVELVSWSLFGKKKGCESARAFCSKPSATGDVDWLVERLIIGKGHFQTENGSGMGLTESELLKTESFN